MAAAKVGNTRFATGVSVWLMATCQRLELLKGGGPDVGSVKIGRAIVGTGSGFGAECVSVADLKPLWEWLLRKEAQCAREQGLPRS